MPWGNYWVMLIYIFIYRLIEMHNLQCFTFLYEPDLKAKQVSNNEEQGGDWAWQGQEGEGGEEEKNVWANFCD